MRVTPPKKVGGLSHSALVGCTGAPHGTYRFPTGKNVTDGERLCCLVRAENRRRNKEEEKPTSLLSLTLKNTHTPCERRSSASTTPISILSCFPSHSTPYKGGKNSQHPRCRRPRRRLQPSRNPQNQFMPSSMPGAVSSPPTKSSRGIRRREPLPPLPFFPPPKNALQQ